MITKERGRNLNSVDPPRGCFSGTVAALVRSAIGSHTRADNRTPDGTRPDLCSEVCVPLGHTDIHYADRGNNRTWILPSQILRGFSLNRFYNLCDLTTLAEAANKGG